VVKKRDATLVVLVVLGLCGSAWAAELNVPSAYGTIQAAIDAAVSGDTVIVAPGTYTGVGNRDIDFGGKAITVRSVDPYDPFVVEATIIDCNGSEAERHRGFYFHSGEDSNSVLKGFTITNGWAFYSGGGIFCEYSTPTISNCIFSGNYAPGDGGGMLNSYSSPTVVNCVFNGNIAKAGGGGMCNYYSSSPTVVNCIFTDNLTQYLVLTGGGGAGIYNSDNSNPILTNCLFSGNSAASGGGGMTNFGNSNPTLGNCTFIGNSAPYVGGAIDNWWSCSSTLRDCILWNNSPDEIFLYDSSACAIVTYSDVQGGWPGTGNIDADPLFVSAVFGDYCLSQTAAGQASDSPCVDAGSDSAVNLGLGAFTTRTDRIGDSGTVDMGFHYYSISLVYHVDGVNGDNSNDGLSKETAFETIQKGIDTAMDGDTVLVWPGLYLTPHPQNPEEINFFGKNIKLTSTNPTDPNVVNNTVIRGIVQFNGAEEPNCMLRGFSIRDLDHGVIYGNHTHATISYCVISGNGPCGATVLENCDGTISNCVITDNITVYLCGVYPVIFGCHGLIKNCTIANNWSGVGVLDGETTTLTNCIIYYNGEDPNGSDPQIIVGSGGTVNISYCDLQDGLGGISGGGSVNWGPGNIATDPCFVQLGYWEESPSLKLVEGDYHLLSERGRYWPEHDVWVLDGVSSPCIDGGDPTIDPSNERMPNGGKVNMGAYGETAYASMSEWATEGDINKDGVVNMIDFAILAEDWLEALPWAE